MTTKQKVYQQCQQVLNQKKSLLQLSLQELRESATNETKRTAGDKHETALAMLQIEQENNSRQLGILLAQQLTLQKIDINSSNKNIALGSLVKTNRNNLFISIGIGKLYVDNTVWLALSAESPLGSKLLGHKKEDVVTINNTSYTITSVE